jgi:hypothetical protein
MERLILIFIISLSTYASYSQTNKLDLTGLRSEESKDDYGIIKTKYYDKRDSLVYEINYDSKRKIINGSFGIAIDKHFYDGKGDRVETRYFDKDLKPVRNEGGPAIIKRKFDQNHRLLEEGFYYENEKLVTSDFAVFQYKYDDKGQLVEEIELNQNRIPSGANPIKKYTNDERGRRIEEKLFDKNNRIIKTGGSIQYSSVKFEYSQDNRIIKKSFFTEQGDLIDGKAVVRISYDKRPPTRTSIDAIDKDAKWMELIYFDKNGNEIDKEYEYIPKSAR